MTDSNASLGERVRSWGRIKFAGASLAFAAGVLVMLFGIAIEGVPMLAFTLFGTLPFALGLLVFARVAWGPVTNTDRTSQVSEPMEELKRRYAAGEIEDETLERKVEALLDADGRSP